MPYAIMRFKKTRTGGIAPAQKHNEREKTKYKSNPDIDAKRIKDDYLSSLTSPIVQLSKINSHLPTVAYGRTAS